ncbi:MAG: SpoIIIAH-like family protein [Oscillospiraceae bacterium]|nr:SpoIIIAH-like family protein [Oscillospiraceae bacterium]
MKQVWKRNAVVSLVLVLVCAAVYLNWRYADNVAQTEGKVLGESVLVSDEVTENSDEAAIYETEGDYFATARLTRQQARDSALALLQEAAAEENADQSVLDEAVASMQVMASYTLSEAQIENLVTAKGYSDCVAFMSEESISVVVSADEDGLTDTDVARITDIVITETGYAADQIKIMETN